MAYLILFSGGCNSGKTTMLKAVASKLQSLGHKVNILDELIRKETDKPIDELRKDAKSYLKLQDKIIRRKIEQEKAALEDESKTIYLADRAVTDSLFYLENYVDKSQLDDEESLKLFCRLHSFAHRYLDYNFWLYSLVIEFKPIAVKEYDSFRPTYISMLKEYESTCISRMNYVYSNGYAAGNYMTVNLNSTTTEKATAKIIKSIESLIHGSNIN